MTCSIVIHLHHKYVRLSWLCLDKLYRAIVLDVHQWDTKLNVKVQTNSSDDRVWIIMKSPKIDTSSCSPFDLTETFHLKMNFFLCKYFYYRKQRRYYHHFGHSIVFFFFFFKLIFVILLWFILNLHDFAWINFNSRKNPAIKPTSTT